MGEAEPVAWLPLRVRALLTTLPKTEALVWLLVTAIWALSALLPTKPVPASSWAVKVALLLSCEEAKPVFGLLKLFTAKAMLLVPRLALTLAELVLLLTVTDESSMAPPVTPVSAMVVAEKMLLLIFCWLAKAKSDSTSALPSEYILAVA
jgi:hypothetical protein